MPRLPGLDADIYFGDPDKPLPALDAPDDAPDDEDEPTAEERAAVAAVLGFDPSELT